ncbi:MAG: PAS domain-containing protein [Bacteroidia bacterium]
MHSILSWLLGAWGLASTLALIWLFLKYKADLRNEKSLQKHVSFWYRSTKEVVMLFAVEGENRFRIIAANGAAERFVKRFGDPDYSTEIVGKEVREVFEKQLGFSAPEADYKIAQYQACVTKKEPLSFEEQSQIRDFGELITQTRVNPILSAKGEVVQLSYTAFDISTFRKAAQKSEEANQLLIEAQQIAQIGVWHWNAEISVFEWSPSMKTIFGLNVDETLSFDQWVKMIHPDDESRVRQEIETAFAELKSFSLEHKIIRKDGQIRYLNTWGGLRISDKGEVREVFGLCRDRTEEKEAEDRLLAAVIKAEDNARQTIARDLHDGLGQSLTTVLLNLNILKREGKTLSEIGQKRLTIAQQYLDQSIVETRKIAHTLMPQVVIEFGFELAIQNLLEALEGGKIEFYFFHHLNSDDRLPPKLAVSLYRICQEAIQNILKHADATEVSIQLTEDQDLLQLTIEDNGKGMDKDESLTGGLGLRNIRTRVQALGGLLFIDSKIDEGSVLTIQIPMDTQTYGSVENTHS